MRNALLAILLLSAGCASEEQLQRDALIDRLEAGVKLPEGARRLDEYARHYAFDKDGSVIAVYEPGFSWPDPDWTCSELQSDFTLKDIPCDLGPQGPMTRGGQRRWYQDAKQLPLIMDGGCGIIALRFDRNSGRTLEATCNGVA